MSDLTQLLSVVIPLIVSGVVAVYTSQKIQELKDTNAVLLIRIAKLEQALTDKGLPLPTATTGGGGAQ